MISLRFLGLSGRISCNRGRQANIMTAMSKMQRFEITAATQDEREWAAALFAGLEPWITLGATLEQLRKASCDPEYLVYIARADGERCGAIVLHRRGLAGSPYIKSIAVVEQHRSNGAGTALMNFAERLFAAEARHIFLCVSSFNTRARTFYERRGYKAVGELQDYVIEGASEILMHKRLR